MTGPRITIHRIEFGRHSRARRLNPHFGRDSTLVKLSVEVAAGPEPDRAFRRAVGTLVRLCPSLARHRCFGPDGRSFLEGASNAEDSLAHLLEHLVIDLGARLTSLEQLSGVTCAWRSPPNRYDIFVECEGRRAWEFVARLAVWAIARSAQDGGSVPSLYGAVRAFSAVESRPGLLKDVEALRRAARLGDGQAGEILRLVRRFRPGGAAA